MAILPTAAKSSLRLELFCAFFSRVVDEENMVRVLDSFTPSERTQLCRRLGYSKLFNPFAPGGFYDLDLAVFEERQVAKMLIKLSTAGHGEWSDLNFCFKERGSSGWKTKSDISQWMSEQAKTLPHEGHLRGRFVATKNKNNTEQSDALLVEMARELGWR